MANKTYYGVGLHVGEIIQQGLTKSDNTDTKQFFLRVKILGIPNGDGSYDRVPQQYERTVWMALTPKTMPFIVETLKVLGFTGRSILELDPSHPQHVNFVGNQVDLWCKHEAYNGDMREKWQVSRGPQTIEVNGLSAKEARELDALFGKALAGDRKPAAKPANPPLGKPVSTLPTRPDGNVDYGFDGSASGPYDPGITDDDIPF